MECSYQTLHPGGVKFPAAAAALVVILGLSAPALAVPPSQLGAAEPVYERGAHLLRQGRVEEAVPVLARAAELVPEDPDVLKLYLQALLVAGETARAREELDRLVDLDPDDSDLAVFLGLANLRLGDWERAREQLARAAAEAPRSGTAQLLLGVAQQELGELEAARQAYATALRLDPSLEGQVAYRRALLAMDEQRYREALLDFRMAGARLPDSPLAHSAAGYADLLGELNPDPLELYLTAGFGYDSNLTLAGNDSDVSPSDLDAGRGITEIGAAYLFGGARRNLRVGQTLYGTFNTAHADFDQEISRTWAQGYVELGNSVALDIHYAFEFGWVEWERFRRTQAVESGLGLRIGAGLSSRVFLRFEDRHYYESSSPQLDRSGDVEHLGVDFFYALPASWGGDRGWLRAGYRYRVEHTEGDEYDSRGHQPVATLSMILPGGFSLTLDGRFEWRRYEDPSVFKPTGGRRKDRITNVTLGLERELLENIDLGLIYAYTDDHSNVDFFDYSRHQVSLLATYVY